MRFHWDLLEGGHPEKHRLAKIIFFDSEGDHAHTLFFYMRVGAFFARLSAPQAAPVGQFIAFLKRYLPPLAFFFVFVARSLAHARFFRDCARGGAFLSTGLAPAAKCAPAVPVASSARKVGDRLRCCPNVGSEADATRNMSSQRSLRYNVNSASAFNHFPRKTSLRRNIRGNPFSCIAPSTLISFEANAQTRSGLAQ